MLFRKGQAPVCRALFRSQHPVPGDLTPSSGLDRHLHSCAPPHLHFITNKIDHKTHLQTHTHTYTEPCFLSFSRQGFFLCVVLATGCPGTHSGDQDGLEFTVIRLPRPPECATTPSSETLFLAYKIIQVH